MNQKLIFEDAWDRTIAPKDRERIKDQFSHAKNQLMKDPIQFTALQEAINHKGELLITVLVHNISDTKFFFHEDILEFTHHESGEVMAERTFTIPRLSIEKHTSMPWTFIFPRHNLNHNQPLAGFLAFKNKTFE